MTQTHLSDGSPNTLAQWRRIAAALGGENSGATRFVDERIAESGPDSLVIIAEEQMLLLIMTLVVEENEPDKAE